jgi:hypothetical protein
MFLLSERECYGKYLKCQIGLHSPKTHKCAVVTSLLTNFSTAAQHVEHTGYQVTCTHNCTGKI